jgi:hypothetical protein
MLAAAADNSATVNPPAAQNGMDPQPAEQTATQQIQPQPTTDATAKPVESTFVEHFNKMLDQYGEEYMKKVMELSKQDRYEIVLLVDSGEVEPDPLEPEKSRPVYKGTERKIYRRRPISSGDYHRAEKLRATFQSEKDPLKVADNQARIYQFLAYCYLQMPYSEFVRVEDWTQIKLVLDGCSHRTMYQPGQ